MLPGQSIIPTPKNFITAILTNLANPPPPGITPKPFSPGSTNREQIDQLSQEDPIYGAIVKSIETGSAAKSLLASGADPYTAFAAAHLARELPTLGTRFWNWITDRTGHRNEPGLGDYKSDPSGFSVY